MRQNLEKVIRSALAGQNYFSAPLFGYADLNDPLFAEYKTIIGNHHMTPKEAFACRYDETPTQGTVVVWILPIVAETIDSNRREKRYPSKAWAHTRHFGEMVNNQVRRAAEEYLLGQGVRTVVPQLLEEWFASYDDCTSSWSERHAAFAAGLGSFGLSDALITEAGVCHRVGSLVTEALFPATARKSDDPYHNCLYKRDGSCGVCQERCPAETISSSGHDKLGCHRYTCDQVYPRCNPQYGVDISGCGLCLTAIPCERQCPV